MQIKLTTLLKTKFNIQDPYEFVRELKKIGDIGARSLRHPFDDIPPEKFDLNVIKKYIQLVDFYGKQKMSQQLRYLPEYWMYRLNITYEEALDKIADDKIKSGQTKEGFIHRHGPDKGLKMYEKFKKTSAYSMSDEWFMNKYGENWKEQKKYEMRRRSKRCVEYWLDKGDTLSEAKQKIKKYQAFTSGVNREYYRLKGFDEDEIDVIMMDINKRKANHYRNTKLLKEKYPDSWRVIYQKNSDDYRKKMEQRGAWINLDVIDSYKKYKALVTKYTNLSLTCYGEFINDLQKRSQQFHLDHKYSIKMGFLNDIDPKIIGSVVNLEILPFSANLSKRAKCSITKKHLLTEFHKFKENYEN